MSFNLKACTFTTSRYYYDVYKACTFTTCKDCTFRLADSRRVPYSFCTHARAAGTYTTELTEVTNSTRYVLGDKTQQHALRPMQKPPAPPTLQLGSSRVATVSSVIAFFDGHSSQRPSASPVPPNLVPARLVLKCSETGSTFKLREAGKMNSEQTQSSSSEQNQSSAPSPSQPALNVSAQNSLAWKA